MMKHALALVVAALLLAGCGCSASTQQTPQTDQVIATAFSDHQSGFQVTGSGTVVRILPDDIDGGRHQRFILELSSGQTLLIAHNIDIAPRIPAPKAGDSVKFSGVYEWNGEGGVVHWTHHDPDGGHTPGWLDHNGLRYQ
jgi:ABC-type glycerol-3-phosphate transport system substrate-binding protein